MQTSRFQLGLIATLAVGLGFALASSDAVGYPAGAAVSLGTNPVWSGGGQIASGVALSIVSAPSDQDVVLTDLLVQMNTSADTSAWFTLDLDDGTRLGQYKVWTYANRGGPLEHTFASGIRVPAGRSLFFTNCHCGETVNYIAAGYYAQP